MGGLMGGAPKVPATPTAPTAPVGTANTATAAGQTQMLAAQRASAMQGGTVTQGSAKASTTKTLLGQ
jgi:hypothetical protein